jgi:dipeptidyl aminopeptidase/acylaminoacyl peptidase
MAAAAKIAPGAALLPGTMPGTMACDCPHFNFPMFSDRRRLVMRTTPSRNGFCLAPPIGAALALAFLAGCQPPPRVDAPGKESPSSDSTAASAAEIATAPSEKAQAASDNKSSTTPANADKNSKEVKLIPRSVLFGNPQKAAARISPNGKWLSYLAPVDGILNVFVAPIDDISKAKQVTDDKKRDIPGYSWAYTGEHILHSQDTGGDEEWHVYATDVETLKTTDLTPIDGVHATIDSVSEKFPDEIVIGLNDRDPQHHDLYKVNIRTGERELIQHNPGLAAFMTDDDFNVRFAYNYTPDGGTVLLKMPDEGAKEATLEDAAEWAEFMKVGPLDAMTTSPMGFNKDATAIYIQDSRDRDTGAMFSVEIGTGKQTLIAENPKADVGEVIIHPTEKTVQAVGFTYARREWTIIDPAIKDDLDYLATVEDGELVVTSRTLDDTKWTVAYLLDDGPLKYYLYDRKAKKATFLFANRDDLDGYPLVKMHDVLVKTRDGLELVCYLSLPKASDPDGDGVPDEALPMVLDVHGGPWARDDWGYNPYHQWLANRGYAVLSVNYRGSTGFGKKFVNAADGEWSRKMHDDLIDAVNWAVEKKIADKDKVCIMGGSYGGYATLVALTFTPDVFACGVDIVGPSSLVTLLQNVPPYWMPFMPVMKIRVGDVSTEEGRKALLERSPLTLVDKISKPLLIGQGANDPRVTQLEADQIVEAMQAKKIPVTYVLYPDEGHGFRREENRMSFNAVTEAFLAEHLGGQFQPIGDDFEGASIYVPTGADEVPGLKEALPKDRTQMPPQEEVEAKPAA